MSENLGQRDDVTGADDLTRIDGIGQRRAERLNAAGIRTYAGLASSSRDDVAKVLPDVGLAKIDLWIGKAGELAPAVPAKLVPEPVAGDGQHYESVLVRILLNEDGSIRRMTARHVRTGTERHWPTLDREALAAFVEMAIAAAAPSAETPGAPSAETPVAAPAGQTRHAERPRPGRLHPTEVHGAPAGLEGPRHASSAVLSVERTPLHAAEPFTMTMTIELAEPACHADRLAYSAVVVAMPLTGGQKQTVAKSDGVLATTSPVISLGAAGLSPGAYRLDAAVSLREPGADHQMDLAGIAEGLLVQVLPG